MPTSMQIELPDEVNTKVEVYQAIKKLQNKKVAVVEMLKEFDVNYESTKED